MCMMTSGENCAERDSQPKTKTTSVVMFSTMLVGRRLFSTDVGKGTLMRISKRIALSGNYSRRQADELVSKKRVLVNGVPCQLGTTVGEGDSVRVDGVDIKSPPPVKIFIAHKMKGELVSRIDPAGRPTLMQRLDKMGVPKPVFPVGRLDFDSEGLLLLSNNGDIARALELPSNRVTRTYRVRAIGRVHEKGLALLRKGAMVDKVRYRPMKVEVLSADGEEAYLEIVLTEGKNREIRRCLEHVGLKVTQLVRTAYGPYSLTKVPRGSVLEVVPKALRRLQLGPLVESLLRPPVKKKDKVKNNKGKGQQPQQQQGQQEKEGAVASGGHGKKKGGTRGGDSTKAGSGRDSKALKAERREYLSRRSDQAKDEGETE